MKNLNIRSVKELKECVGKHVLLRVDFNVPIVNGRVRDDFRIRKALPTIEFLRRKKAKIILISHLGSDGKASLAPVAKSLSQFLPVTFVPDIIGEKAQSAISQMKAGEIVLLENIRRQPGEKTNSSAFAKKLASLADIYVNDAFSVSHRAQASIVAVTKYLPAYGGLQMLAEIEHLSKAFQPKHPFVVILGGAKFETKLPLIKKYAKTADSVCIAGALINQFYKEEGYGIGHSLVSEENFNLNKLRQTHGKESNIYLPTDVTLTGPHGARVAAPQDVGVAETIVDIGPDSLKFIQEKIKTAKLVLWNGPTGNYENGFDKMTIAILKSLAASRGESIIGGGDTVAIISKKKMENNFTFVSTGGGATLDFLAKGMLPGIRPLLNS